MMFSEWRIYGGTMSPDDTLLMGLRQ